MKRLLSIIGLLLTTVFASAQTDDFNPSNPPEPSATYKVKVAVLPEEAATTSGTGEYAEGASVSVRASAKSNYVFKHWLQNGETISQTSTSFTLTMPAYDVELVAVFEYQEPIFDPRNPDEPQFVEQSYKLYFVADPADGGSFNYSNGTSVKEGSEVSLRANPATGYQFVAWLDSEGNQLATTSTMNYTMPRHDVTLTAHFEYNPSNPNEPSEPSGGQESVDNTEQTEVFIAFADTKTKALCVQNWDDNNDGELSEREAAAVTTLGNVFRNSDITSFNELKYFTGLSSLSNNAFTYCTSLQSLCIPCNVAGIGESVFAGCSKLTSLSVDTGNKYFCVEDGILYNADQSQLLVCLPYKTGALTIKDKVRVLSDNAFYNCTGLTSIILPSQLQYISLAVFVGCSSLTTLNIPASVLSIGYGNFTGCTNLQSITVDAGNENYTSVDGVLYNKDKTALLAFPNKAGTVLEIPDGTTSIEAYAFSLTGIQEVDIPASVTRLGSYALSYCGQLTKITVHAKKPFTLDENAFSEDVYAAATLYVPKGKQSLYEEAEGWSAFDIEELEYSEELGDADNNGVVDGDDVKAIARYITEGDYEGFCFDNADMNGDQKVDAADIVLLINDVNKAN